MQVLDSGGNLIEMKFSLKLVELSFLDYFLKEFPSLGQLQHDEQVVLDR